MFKIHVHFEADDIVIGLRHSGNRVSRASVYRTLPLLVECGLLRDVYSAEKHCHYEHVFGHEHHDHLICSGCGSTIEFSNSEIEAMQDRICKEYGFFPVRHKLEITGLCKECKSDN
ncbi:MAG: Fur family transcriptional regulator [Armatimonadota bacterium]